MGKYKEHEILTKLMEEYEIKISEDAVSSFDKTIEELSDVLHEKTWFAAERSKIITIIERLKESDQLTIDNLIAEIKGINGRYQVIIPEDITIDLEQSPKDIFESIEKYIYRYKNNYTVNIVSTLEQALESGTLSEESFDSLCTSLQKYIGNLDVTDPEESKIIDRIQKLLGDENPNIEELRTTLEGNQEDIRLLIREVMDWDNLFRKREDGKFWLSRANMHSNDVTATSIVYIDYILASLGFDIGDIGSEQLSSIRNTLIHTIWVCENEWACGGMQGELYSALDIDTRSQDSKNVRTYWDLLTKQEKTIEEFILPHVTVPSLKSEQRDAKYYQLRDYVEFLELSTCITTNFDSQHLLRSSITSEQRLQISQRLLFNINKGGAIYTFIREILEDVNLSSTEEKAARIASSKLFSGIDKSYIEFAIERSFDTEAATATLCEWLVRPHEYFIGKITGLEEEYTGNNKENNRNKENSLEESGKISNELIAETEKNSKKI